VVPSQVWGVGWGAQPAGGLVWVICHVPTSRSLKRTILGLVCLPHTVNGGEPGDQRDGLVAERRVTQEPCDFHDRLSLHIWFELVIPPPP
jgi:hypothetical protein